MIKTVLEDVADNLFNPDPYYQQGGDMVRVGGSPTHRTRRRRWAARISDMRLKPAMAIDPARPTGGRLGAGGRAKTAGNAAGCRREWLKAGRAVAPRRINWPRLAIRHGRL